MAVVQGGQGGKQAHLLVFFFNLALCMTKHRVLVLCFSYFMDNSNIGQGLWKLRIAGKFVAEGEELISNGNALE